MENLSNSVWVCRSFYNRTEHLDDMNQLLFGEGKFVFESSSAPEIIRGTMTLSPKNHYRLTLKGYLQGSHVRFQGKGMKGTPTSGWVYDFIGYFVPEWSGGIEQKSVLVGSLIRTAPHDGKSAGETASFIAVQRDFLEVREVLPLPDKVLHMLASRKHRLHHFIWHSIRDRWCILSEKKRKQMREKGWQPGEKSDERPSINSAGAPYISNGSGEDFLFMHRRMIQEVNSMMDKPIWGWPEIPAPGSLDIDVIPAKPISEEDLSLGNPDGFAVPPAWDSSNELLNKRIKQLKADGFYWSRMKWWDREFKNSQYLSTLTLGELGSLLEWTVHNDMHMRWSSVPRDPISGEVLPDGRKNPDDLDFKWDEPHYDFLGDPYSAHVNPIFWRLHGWIDDRIEDWFQAHAAVHPEEIERSEIKGVPWFKRGKWVHIDHPWSGPLHGCLDEKDMEMIVHILFRDPCLCSKENAFTHWY
ncbi:hypothetical protein AXI59_00155 [Bacillus nakamurai]|uniref:hypothetical protein n=1 Tax=Bacillus nakamurai TaxID=1793963 RepID=UPI0007788082|nr:hypothetical protein [Bacillus nakamurai]KXZ24139.1 hypothetical protein AXI59_00155 [Bacillus nakamurai]